MSSIGSGTSGGMDSLLLGYYQAQLAASPSSVAAAAATTPQASNSKSATAHDVLPWNQAQPAQTAAHAKLLSTTNFLDTSKVPLSPGATTDAKTEQDNQKLFSVYNAVNSLSQLAQMAQSSTATSGQLAGLNTRFQTGLTQIEKYLSATDFNNFALQSATPSASVTSTAQVKLASLTYTTQKFVADANKANPVPNVSSSDSFTIAVKKGGVTTPLTINLSQVQGSLTLSNIVTYINQQLSNGGFSTRFQVSQAGGTAISTKGATYGLQITPGGAETVSLSADSTPALYMVGNSGNATEVETVTGSGAKAQVTSTPANESGRLLKIGNLDGTPTAISTSEQQASSGTTTAEATVVDSSGNVYVLGNATGNFGSQLNQGTQDVYLTKYDSAGNVIWQNLVGSTGTASGYGMALDPAGGVVITGTSTSDLTATSIGDGKNDSFVALYDGHGNQSWVKQIPTLAGNQANAVSVDASGNIYIGGSVTGGVIGSGQATQGGGDAYLATLNSKGKIIAENQFGTSSSDQVSATAIGSDGSLYVASVQNGDAVISKYANGDITAAPVWSQDVGVLQAGGGIGGLTVSSGGQLYLSGTTSNAHLTNGGQASIATGSSGGTDAFVMKLTDNGASVSANQISYIGTSASDQGGATTVGSDGTVYLTGTTTGTFSGQNRSVQKTDNAFVTALNTDGSVKWTQQYGGASGQSTGAAVAIDPNGASVLDALGLPSGTVNVNQSVALSSQTTLRAGDTFQIKTDGPSPRTATVSISAGETFDSLVTKINGELGGAGKASTNYTGRAEDLKITANAGQSIELIAGPSASDALARLGLAAGTISAPAANSKASTPASSKTGDNPTYGLGLTGGLSAITGGALDISTKTGADLARSQLLTVLSNIQNIYQKSNAPPPSPTTPGNNSGTASTASTSQLASYSTALSLLGTSSSTAVNNIQMIAQGYDPNSAAANSANNSAGSILGLF